MYNSNMLHISTHYGETRHAEVFRLEDNTYVVYMYAEGEEPRHVYYDTLSDVEDRAEEFVLL